MKNQGGTEYHERQGNLCTRQYDEGIAVGREEGIIEGKVQGTISTLQCLVDDGTISYEKAAAVAGISVAEFKNEVQNLK